MQIAVMGIGKYDGKWHGVAPVITTHGSRNYPPTNSPGTWQGGSWKTHFTFRGTPCQKEGGRVSNTDAEP